MVRFWHFVAHFNELGVLQVLRTQESAAPSLRYAHSLNTVASASAIPQICVWPPPAAARVHNRFFCNLLHFVAILLQFCCILLPACLCRGGGFYAPYKFDTITDKNLCVLQSCDLLPLQFCCLLWPTSF